MSLIFTLIVHILPFQTFSRDDILENDKVRYDEMQFLDSKYSKDLHVREFARSGLRGHPSGI